MKKQGLPYCLERWAAVPRISWLTGARDGANAPRCGVDHTDAGVEAIYLEEPEFWVKNGYSEGFKREWRNYYGEDWQPPYSSVDAAWKASKLKYFLRQSMPDFLLMRLALLSAT